jgi:RimJ/RimL family protein N-acetyltransferase
MSALTITTDRLILRPFTLQDAPRVRRLAGAWDVASMVGNIPHPYPEGLAESWISQHGDLRVRGKAYPFALTWCDQVIGSVGIHQNDDEQPEIGYWLGVPYWGMGFGTEAAAAILAFGFDWLGHERVTADHIVDNQASGRVLAKLGFVATGRRTRQSAARGRVECIDLTLTRDAWAAKKV